LVEYFSQQSREQLASVRQAVKMKIAGVQDTIKEWETKVNNASERIAAYERLKLEVERLQGLHDRLLGLLQTVDVTRNLDQENITILDGASEAKPGKLNPALVIAFAIFMSIGTALVLVLLVERTDDRLMSFDEMTCRFDEWIIGQVPEVQNLRTQKRPALLEVNDERHMYSESYRNLRSALIFGLASDKQALPKTLLITSAIPEEGKSTVAVNLARTLAMGGSRVLLVDADMRRGALDTLMELKHEPGLSDLLSQGVCDPHKFIKQIPLPGNNSQLSTLNSGSHLRPPPSSLYFLSRGGDLNNPGDLFLSPKLDATLLRWRQEFDYVLIDSCPVFAADDATTLAPKVDGTLFVVRSRFTRASTVHRALELLYQRQAKVLGLVFNQADSSSRGYECYKYKGYHRAAKPVSNRMAESEPSAPGD
jgi:capsular exopolysaccharide synthesis family protein